MTGRTPYFGTVGDPIQRAQVLAVVNRLAPANPQLQIDGGFLFSAASYLMRDGQPLNDSRVLEEARRRKRYFNATMASNKALRGRWDAELAAAKSEAAA